MSIQKATIFLAPLLGVLAFVFVSENAVNAENDNSSDIVTEEMDEYENDTFPKGVKYLVPPPVPLLSDPDRSFDTEHVAYGAVDKSEELQQPIAYSHKLHAGEMQIECQYCHTYARRSIHAGIPSTQICMNCHGKDPSGQAKVSLEKDGKPRVELLKLLTFYYGRADVSAMVGEEVAKQIPEKVSTAKGEVEVKKGEIPWVKVHDVPDFVYFAHKPHVRAGVLCQECHGEVQDDMTVGRRVSELTMGWCLNCHESHPSITSNYCENQDASAGANTDEQSSCYAEQLRRTEIKDCWNCHK